ncbi:hypothetical protein BD769DRAFT_1610467 [Suillus cothurnatus]|nr:hypothetical protein BD769DRAFT_1610467 [Suillus cothurnatus]
MPNHPTERDTYGAHAVLLYSLFDAITPGYTVHPQYPVGRDTIHFVITFALTTKASPVFSVEVKPPSHITTASKRKAADEQMRSRFPELRDQIRIPTLHGMSAMGSMVCFYEMETATGQISPDDTDWNLDIMTPVGWQKLMAVIFHIKTMVDALP